MMYVKVMGLFAKYPLSLLNTAYGYNSLAQCSDSDL